VQISIDTTSFDSDDRVGQRGPVLPETGIAATPATEPVGNLAAITRCICNFAGGELHALSLTEGR